MRDSARALAGRCERVVRRRRRRGAAQDDGSSAAAAAAARTCRASRPVGTVVAASRRA